MPDTSWEVMSFVPWLLGSSGRLESQAYFLSNFPLEQGSLPI